MAWLLRDATVLASLEVADSFGSRLKGLLGRTGIDGALLIPHVRSVHSFGMKFAIDVAFCDDHMVVIETCALRPNRMTLPRPRARYVLEAESGAFERWQLRPGDQLEAKAGDGGNGG